MNKEQAKNIKVGTKLINIKTYSVGKLTDINNEYSYYYTIYENEKNDSYLWGSLDGWYTKEQLKEIKVSSLQAVNLLQNGDFFEIGDSFEGLNGEKTRGLKAALKYVKEHDMGMTEEQIQEASDM